MYLIDRETYAITEARITHSIGKYETCRTYEDATDKAGRMIIDEIDKINKRKGELFGIMVQTLRRGNKK